MRWFSITGLSLIALSLGGCGFIEPTAREFPSPAAATACDQQPIPGVEDIARNPRNGDLYLASLDRAALGHGATVGGAIYRLRFDHEGQPMLAELHRDGPQGIGFLPHGIGLYSAPYGGADGKARLFVVNHPAPPGQTTRKNPFGPPHAIEVFDIDGDNLRHVRTITDAERLVSPNDVSPTGPDSFFVSNDHGAAKGLGRFMEDWFQFSNASVMYFNGHDFSVAADHLSYANGVMLDRANDRLLVASTQTGKMYIFPLSGEPGGLGPATEIRPGGGLDNIEIDDRGHIWITLHPHLRTTYFYLEGMFGTDGAPSRVIELAPRDDGTFDITTVFDDDGSLLSGASVAGRIETPDGPRLIVGAILEPHFLVCRLPG